MTNMRPPRRRTPKLTAPELATAKQVSVQAVRQAIKRGILRAEKKGRGWLISPTDAEAWQPRLDWAPGRSRERDDE